MYGGQRILAFKLTTAVAGAYRYGVLKVITKANIQNQQTCLLKEDFVKRRCHELFYMKILLGNIQKKTHAPMCS